MQLAQIVDILVCLFFPATRQGVLKAPWNSLLNDLPLGIFIRFLSFPQRDLLEEKDSNQAKQDNH
jgi:hypothetical protein